MNKIILCIIFINYFSAYSNSQETVVDSNIFILYEKFKNNFLNSNSILIKDTIFRAHKIDSENLYRIDGWRGDFTRLPNHGKMYFDSSENFYYPFSIHVASGNSLNKYYCEGFIYKYEVYVNLKRYCLAKKNVMLNFSTNDSIDSFVEKLANNFDFKYKRIREFPKTIYQIAVPGFPKYNTYLPLIELNSNKEIGLDSYPSNLTSIISNIYFIKEGNCDCSKYDPVVVFIDRNIYHKKGPKRHRRIDVYKEVFVTFDYFMIKISDMTMIQKGTFSLESDTKYK